MTYSMAARAAAHPRVPGPGPAHPRTMPARLARE